MQQTNTIVSAPPTPQKRLRKLYGSSAPMDVTSTNFFTLARLAAEMRFKVPCSSGVWRLWRLWGAVGVGRRQGRGWATAGW